MSKILELNRKDGLQFFYKLLQAIGISTADQIVAASYSVLKSGADELLTQLEQDWYESLATGQPNYDLYDTDNYLAEVWYCYETYSKKYLREIQKERSLPPFGIYAQNKNAQLLVDLGNGLGITSAVLTEMFPAATVIGTNVPNSSQYKMAQILANQYGFTMVSDANEIKQQADLLFASEYFEHFQNPIEHLLHVIENLHPKRMLIANTFTNNATGHFNFYLHQGKEIDGKTMSRLFNATLRSLGYQKVVTKMWNNRPTYWELGA
jgi:2-polyprenyl-3-methyl-5-hydroxy-6-metoxy-1,4-benzoquinol methylase